MKTSVRQLIEGKYSAQAKAIRDLAHSIHAEVNQTYGDNLPYGYHLDMVAEAMLRHADEVIACPADVLPIWFGAYFHDSIEDARLTYNDVLATARRQLPDQAQALMATEIAYALTNEKGRNRAERANDRYYSLIRVTPYAPLMKLADRIANMTYSRSHRDAQHCMLSVYARELPHFLKAIVDPAATDRRLLIPASMVEEVKALCSIP